jgi:hypothetical protein
MVDVLVATTSKLVTRSVGADVTLILVVPKVKAVSEQTRVLIKMGVRSIITTGGRSS